jgi:predicted transposase/invertase (TIGR01784 family)
VNSKITNRKQKNYGKKQLHPFRLGDQAPVTSEGQLCSTEGFLSTLLGEPVRIERILESESNKTEENDKFNRVDILAEDSRGELIIIEVQNNRELDYFHRMLYGTSKAITEYVSESEPYAQVRKLYSVNIVYFDLGQGKDYVYHGRTEFRGIHEHDTLKLTSSQQAQFMKKEAGDLYPEYYVLRVEDFDKMAVTPLDEWISFLKTGDIPDNAKAPGLAEAREQLDVHKMSRAERAEYYAHMEAIRYQRSVLQTGLIEGRMEGLAEGLAEGEKKGLEKSVLAAYRNSLSIEQIQAFSGLSEEQIHEILKRNSNLD